MKRIKTLDQLHLAALRKQSVVIKKSYADMDTFSPPVPASFMMNRFGSHLHRIFHLGLYIYEKRKDRFAPPPWERRNKKVVS